MKKFIVILVAIISLGSPLLYSQTGWYQQNSGTNINFETVCFINEQTGFISGNGFTIIRTTNGGTNWTQYVLPDSCNIFSIRFLNNNTGYASAGFSINIGLSVQFLFKTTNTGNNWVRIWNNANNIGTFDVKDVFPINSSVYMATGGNSEFNTYGGLLTSQNSGANFTLSFYRDESTDKLSFINSLTGWYSATYLTDLNMIKRKIYKTTNSGSNWTMQYRDSTLQFDWYGQDFELQFINSNTGFGMYKKPGNVVKFLKTSNSGTAWDTTTIPYVKYRGMFFSDTNTGWVCGSSTPDSVMIIRTTNAGTNWIIQRKGYGTITAINFVNNYTGWAVGYNGVIMKTVTGGVTGVQNISSGIPSSYSLSQNYPNPFNPSANVKFSIVKTGDVKVVVYDIQGKELQTLVNERLSTGTYEVKFDGSSLNSGVYFYKMTAGNFTETKRMILIK